MIIGVLVGAYAGGFFTSAARLRAALFTQLATVVVVPLLVVAFGIARLLLRRRRATQMLRDEEG